MAGLLVFSLVVFVGCVVLLTAVAAIAWAIDRRRAPMKKKRGKKC